MILQRVPHYRNVTVTSSGNLKVSPFDPFRNLSGGSASRTGVLAFRASGTVLVQGVLQANGAGWDGGRAIDGGVRGTAGGSIWGVAGSGGTDPNRGGGGAGNYCGSTGGSGAGGSYGTTGASVASCAGCAGGTAGIVLGDAQMSRLFLGSGGGAGSSSSSCASMIGGRGGGGVFVLAENLVVTGTIRANGTDGGASCGGTRGGGGGGSGGFVWLSAGTATLAADSVQATGGVGGATTGTCASTPGGVGGQGRIRLDFDALNGVPYPNASGVAASTTPDAGHSAPPE